MTKERKLAIQMWEDILNMLENYEFVSSHDIAYYKYSFTVGHNLNWLSNCWFCQYIRTDSDSYHRCKKCPLGSCCSPKSQYSIVTNEKHGREKRINACKKIISALKGEYHYDKRT